MHNISWLELINESGYFHERTMSHMGSVSYFTWSILRAIEDKYAETFHPEKRVPWVWLQSNAIGSSQLDNILTQIPYTSNKIGKYAWEFDSTYAAPVVGDALNAKGVFWFGVIRFTDTETNTSFFFTRAHNNNNNHYYGFSIDINQIKDFSEYLLQTLLTDTKNKVHIEYYEGDDVYLSLDAKDFIILEENLYKDILFQVNSFYKNKPVYEKLNVPYKRGFLFTGNPGNGKTLMVRHIIKEMHKSYGIDATIIGCSGNRFCEGDLKFAIEELQNRNPVYPGILVIDDMDTLVSETGLTRAGFLSVLDGLTPTEGILILGTTNNPELIDPALLHRPSRFDRIFHFDLPTQELRERYIKTIFEEGQIDSELLGYVVKNTHGWSFAYLNELRICSALLSIDSGKETTDSDSLRKAFDMLQIQFKNTKNPENLSSTPHNKVGF